VSIRRSRPRPSLASAATFNEDGVTALYQHLARLLAGHGLPLADGVLPRVAGRTSTDAASVIPPSRAGYLAEIAATVRGYHEQTARQAAAVRRVQRIAAVRAEVSGDTERTLASLLTQAEREVGEDSAALIAGWPAIKDAYSGQEQVVRIRDRELRTRLRRESLSGSQIPRVALPRYADHGPLYAFTELMSRNAAGSSSLGISRSGTPKSLVSGPAVPAPRGVLTDGNTTPTVRSGREQEESGHGSPRMRVQAACRPQG
jgi:methylmalonyl-CoA mutase